MANRNKFSIVDNDDAEIVVKETAVHLTDEKIKSILYRTYERAQKDTKKKCVCNYYGCCFSVSATLFWSLVTATFHDFLFLSAKDCEMIAKIGLWGMGIVGLALFIWKRMAKMDDDTTHRDKAVDEVFSKYIKGC